MTATAAPRGRRWPAHPPPAPGEALTSWLGRLAAVYELSVDQLLRHNLGPASAQLNHLAADELDFDPPIEILRELAERTGLQVGELRLLVIAGWVPWLADTLDPCDGQQAFDTYVRQDSVLFSPGELGGNVVPHWLPWLAVHTEHWWTMRRLCPLCAADPANGVPLLAALPITLSCGIHGCRLELELTARVRPALGDPDPARPVTPAVAALDQLTHQALTTGSVTLPGRPDHPVHIGVWLRLLRTLLDEVSTSTARLSAASTRTMATIWGTAGQRIRGGLAMWRPYERLDTQHKEAMLTAAATAVHLARTGAIAPRGTLGRLLIPPQHQPVHDGDYPVPDKWQEILTALEHVVIQARLDPGAARRLLNILAIGCRTHARFNRYCDGLLDLGIPAEHLPTAAELGLDDLT